MAVPESVFAQYGKPVLVGVGVTFIILEIFIVGLRFYARRRSPWFVGIDDWLILLALILCTAAGIVNLVAAEIGGLGQRQQLGPQGELMHTSTLTNFEKCRYAIHVITTANLGIVKISILCFYRRLFIIKPFKIASGIMIAIVASWSFSFTIAMIAQCSPVSYFWQAFGIDYPKHCIQMNMMYQALAYSDLILDVLVLALPIPMVASLHMPWRTKIKVIDGLMLGVVVLGSGIARVVSLAQVIRFSTRNPDTYYKDPTYYTGGPLFWIFAENAIAIIGACLPTLAPLWSSQRRPSKRKSFWPSPSSHSKCYNDLEGHYRFRSDPDATSINRLVGLGTATDIQAQEIALENRAKEGIEVHTTLEATDHRR